MAVDGMKRWLTVVTVQSSSTHWH